MGTRVAISPPVSCDPVRSRPSATPGEVREVSSRPGRPASISGPVGGLSDELASHLCSELSRGLRPCYNPECFCSGFHRDSPDSASVQESTEYLRHTREVLSTVLDGLDPRYLDAQSVRLLQGRCPAWSRVDQAHVHAQFQAGKVFAAVVDHTERSDLEARLMTVDTMFPSLQTWIEAIGVLEAGAPVLKKLLPTKSHICTLQQEAFRSFRTARRPSRSQRRSWESTRDLFWAAYRQLWLVALRYSRGAHRAPSTRVLRTVARQAHELGFDSPAINQYMSSPPLASETVPSFEPCATASPLTAAIVNDQTTPSVARRTRLSPRVLRQSQRYLTLDRVYSDVPVAAGQTLTAFGIVRDVLRVCFHHRAMWIAGPMPSRFMSSGFMPSTPTPSRSTPSRPTPSLPSRLLHTRSHWSDQSIRMIANGPYDGHHSQEPTGRVLSSMSQARPLSRTASSGSQYSRDSPWEARPVHKSPGSQPPRVSEDTRQPRPLLLTHIPAENHVIRATRASLVHTLQGRECNQTPSQAQSQLTTRSPDASAVVYHYASPAMLYELPAAQAQQLFADRIVAQGERQWYAIWDDNRLKPFAPCQIVQYLGSKVIIYGDANSFHRAQQDQLP